MAQSGKKTVILKIRRQEDPKSSPRWEEFELAWKPGMNVISAMMEIAANPVTRDGKTTTPIAYDSNCLEEVCGSCAMLINGKARMACSALVDQLEQPIILEPFSKFPVVRDLAVDRQFMFDSLKRVQAWIPIDGTYDLGEGPRMAAETQEKAYKLSTCISCGSCLEVCPQVTGKGPGDFMGAAIMSQVRLFNMHPTGAMHARARIEAVMQPGGIQDCANAQNCVKACPKEIPLTESLAEINRQAWKQAFVGWLIG